MNRSHPILAAVAVALLVEGCASAPREQRLPIAPLGAREAQTRFFEGVSANTAMKAAIDMLQDGEFSIDHVDAALGIIIATRSSVDRPSTEKKMLKWMAIGMTYGVAALLPWQKTEAVELEASVNVTAIDDGSRVRLTLQRRLLDNNGRPKKVEAIADGVIYRDLFELLNRSLFVATEM